MSGFFHSFQTYRHRLSKIASDPGVRWSWQALWTVPLIIFVNDHLIEINSVDGQSMSPTLSPHFHETGSRDYLVVWKPGATQNVRRGEIVAYWSPRDPENLKIKRVIATAGDTVYPKESRFKKELVPYGHIWVEGDNWRKTRDSNDYGPISKALIIGKPKYIIWPWNRMGALSTEWHHPRTRVVPGEAEIPKEFVD